MDNILDRCKRIHLVGIGGISMSSIAFVLNRHGCVVSGSDINLSELTDELSAAGIKVIHGHSPDNISSDIELVIYTADVHGENSEILRAKELGIPCISRATALGYLMLGYRCPIGISGTHGKSTTTSMLSEIFTGASADPTVLSGAELSSNHGAYRLGTKDYFIFEACEYAESFLHFFPKVAIVLNVEEDHLDYYKDINAIKNAFSKFIALCGADGTVIVNADDANALESASAYSGKKITFGLSENADYTAKSIRYNHGKPVFDVYAYGKLYSSVSLSVYGKHNVMNALAAIAAADLCSLPKEQVVEALSRFSGAKRRFELVGKYNGADIVSDYAHHPTEMEATLKAAVQIGYKKVVCVFQPHTFTRTKVFGAEFAKMLSIADKAILAPVYAKRDSNAYGADSSTISALVPGAICLPSLESIADYIKSNAKEDELYILMGAGDINKVADMLK